MKPTRRQVLGSVPALALAGCTLEEPPDESPPTDPCAPEPDAWEPAGALDTVAFPLGLQLTDPTSDGVLVAARTTLAGPVALRVARACAGEWTEVATVNDLPVADDGVVFAELTGLEADSVHAVALFSPGGQERSRPSRFRTAPSASTSRVVRFGATACLGNPGRPWPNLVHAAESRLEFFALLGDTIYADPAQTLAEYREEWRDALAVEGLAELTASTATIGTWDDHEVQNNWSWDDDDFPDQFDAAVQAYSETFPWRDGGGLAGLWRKLSWGATLDVFVLDCRGERQNGDYVSEEQLAWLQVELAASTARFKVVLNSVPITDLDPVFGVAQEEDRWQGFPAQRSELLEFIDSEGIEGVLWLAGDLHYGQIARVGQPEGAGAGYWEVMVGPSGSMINHFAELVQAGPHYAEIQDQFPVFIFEWNYVELTADPDAGTIRVRHIGDDGAPLSDMVLTL